MYCFLMFSYIVSCDYKASKCPCDGFQSHIHLISVLFAKKKRSMHDMNNGDVDHNNNNYDIMLGRF